ncbi:MAG: division/cell wall cluster transcriptional repressor MraZ [Xanthomonadales bacterium]|nr:division/cell wall cluster transcriptional repressor MraZ [Xanthomonadales bacterium]NIN59749.1 division/cell wall cluster transcriptional repressor MraZ [Xanthomonadales bacterium]NIN75518.1 division/cell wall cluster transcriptional repressor MraZ [Xanthomonadales bacterium]NIO15207.1 division/cell wall cluster transcriptional repressor MraZ [Xanthomonadales bacterium]NIP12142.1 division/cell wall cluster transcriptional repressor MraZ [Xanthomonadales bacterium]
MFFGETAVNLDAKGRFAIPTRYREAIQSRCGGRMVLTYSAFDSGALWLYPEEEWQRVRDEAMSLSTFNASHRGLQRRLVGSASPVEPDGNWRILLPQALRQVAGLEKHMVLLGMGSRFEIWNEKTLNQKRLEEEQSLGGEASEEMARLVL